MKKKLLYFFLMVIVTTLPFESCSTTNKVQNLIVTDTLQNVYSNSGIVVSLLEQIRQTYVEALKFQENSETVDAIKTYERAVDLLNNLSYYPDIDSLSDYIELERSILEDYQNFVDNIDELPSDVSLDALKEWLNRKIPTGKNLTKTEIISNDDIPLEVNDYVQNFIDFFTNRGRHHMKNWIARSGKYFPMMKAIFKEEGVPEGLIYLSTIESGLNPRALSRAKAVGLWQFMRSTGSMYGLNSNFYFDERRDPIKATKAAARHLRDLYKNLGNWYLALAAYNSGEGRVRKAMYRANSDNYWEILDKLPRETRGYVPQFIASSIIMKNQEKYGFNDITLEQPLEFETFPVNGCYDLNLIAASMGIELETILELNPELTQDVTPPTSTDFYDLRIPVGKKDIFALNISKIPKTTRKSFVVHKVKRGETLAKIAGKYGISTDLLADANNIPKRIKLKRNSTLKVPIPYKPPEKVDFAFIEQDSTSIIGTNTSVNTDDALLTENASDESDSLVTNENEEQIFADKIDAEEDSTSIGSTSNNLQLNTSNKKSLNYMVRKGDSISKIAQLFSTRITDIRIWNDLAYDRKIHIGQVLKIFVPIQNYEKFASFDVSTTSENLITKGTGNTTPNQKKKLYHTVRKGESLALIAKRYSTDISSIKEWNNIKSNRSLRKGARLKIYTSEENLAEVINKKTNNKNEASSAKPEIKYQVRKGDSLFDIAKKFKVSISDIKEWNNLSSENLKPKQKIIILGNGSHSSLGDNVASKRIYHTIKSGETLDIIAKKYHMSVKELKKFNNLKKSIIRPGQKLLVSIK